MFSAWGVSFIHSFFLPKKNNSLLILQPINVFNSNFINIINSILEFSSDVLYFNYEMRLNKNQIEHMAFITVRNLLKDEKIIAEDKNKLHERIINLITEEFQKEDKLDQEVREILSKHIEKIRKDNIEYQTLFRMIKTKLAKERNIVL